MFKTKFNYIPEEGEKNSGEIITTTAGYLDPQRLIKDMILAGQRLITAREQYDFGPDDEVPDDFIDYSREPNFDLSDASLILNSIKPVEKEEVAESDDPEKEEPAEK